MINRNALLILEDGSSYNAFYFGKNKSSSGEVVFNTAMTGYVESLTDPSYKGQILVFTYPHIGNYGVPALTPDILANLYESDKIYAHGVIISDYSNKPSHWNMAMNLSTFLSRHNVPGLYNIDTRSLTKKIRDYGTMLGKIIIDDNDIKFYNPNIYNLVSQVSTKKKIIYGNGKHLILLLDLGVKYNIIRCLIKRNCTVIRVPWNYDFSKEKYDGILISNGPGDPKICDKSIYNIKLALKNNIPIFGICLGNQILGYAIGANSYKLKYGHRGHNQPVIMKNTNKAFITSQNHSYAVNEKELSPDWNIFFQNLNDGTCEGLIHKTKPFFSVQFHPEASGGPNDTEFLFDKFLNFVKKYKK